MLEVDEDLPGAAFLPVLDDVLKGFDGAVLLVVAVGEVADRADLHVLDDFAWLDLAGGHLGGRVGELNGVHGFSTDNFGVLRRFGVRDGSTAVFFVQIVLQAGLGVLQGGVEGVKRLELRVKSVGLKVFPFRFWYCVSEAGCGIIRGGAALWSRLERRKPFFIVSFQIVSGSKCRPYLRFHCPDQ